MKVSENFSLTELTYSDTAVRRGIKNEPTDEILRNLQKVCQFILEPIRNHFENPVVITSGFRSPELCLAIGSTIKSQHTKGEAVDFLIFGIANKEVADWIVNNLDYDQCILEFWNPEQPNSGWIHCSFSSNNRKQYLRAYKQHGFIVYEPIKNVS
jgi:zinc D-Ala-D-Ala carboxypeptidase